MIAKRFTDQDQANLDKIAEAIRDKDGQLQQQISRGRMMIAENLYKARNILAKPGCKSEFGAWVSDLKIDLNKSSAYNYIKVFESFGKYEHTKLIAWSAMIKLSGKDQEKAREQAKALASQGHKVTVSKADELIEKYSSKTDQPVMDSTARKSDKPKGKDQPKESRPDDRYKGQQASTDEPMVFQIGESQVILKAAEGMNRIELMKQAAELLKAEYDKLMSKANGILDGVKTGLAA